jgi:hypothetical protein
MVICRECGSKELYCLMIMEQYKCKVCKLRHTLPGGTSINISNLSFIQWFIEIHRFADTEINFRVLYCNKKVCLFS